MDSYVHHGSQVTRTGSLRKESNKGLVDKGMSGIRWIPPVKLVLLGQYMKWTHCGWVSKQGLMYPGQDCHGSFTRVL